MKLLLPRIVDFTTAIVRIADDALMCGASGNSGTGSNAVVWFHHTKKFKRTGFVFLVCLVIPFSASAQIKVLFIGNSYTAANNLKNVLRTMAATAFIPVDMTVAAITPGGATFSDHLNNPAVLDAIANGGYDFVVLQDQSQRPAFSPELTKSKARLLDALIQDAGSRTCFFMTWGRESGDPMIGPLAATYTSIAAELGALLAPVGLAWDQARTLDPSISLYTGDGSHPNPNGTYLAACVFYSVLTGYSPVGESKGGLTTVTDDDAIFLQTTAWELLKADFGFEELPATTSVGRIGMALIIIVLAGIFLHKHQRMYL